MQLDEIALVLRRTDEPSEDGIYHVFSSMFSFEHRYEGAIKVWHGPRGGYQRPRRIRMNPTTNGYEYGKKFYWRNGHVWLTEEEYYQHAQRVREAKRKIKEEAQ